MPIKTNQMNGNVDMTANALMESMDTPRILRQPGPVSNNTLGQSMEPLDLQEYTSLQNTFKVSQLVRPKHYQTSQRLLNLQKPKSQMRHKPKDIYDMADFRGLLHADYKDTIKGAFMKDRTAGKID